MILKLHPKSASFKAVAGRLLSAESGRVAWTQTVNLFPSDPEIAWRVMAVTSVDAQRLKNEAGIKPTGRSSQDAVLHVSAYWHPDETPTPSEMTDFGRRVLAALKAHDRQALMICHEEPGRPHLHILVNRVSPDDGRLLSSSNEKRALSALALAYEQENGRVYCQRPGEAAAPARPAAS
jgi:hypothetical protein